MTIYLILNCDTYGDGAIQVKGYLQKVERDKELDKVTKWPCGWRGMDLILDGSQQEAA